MQFDTCGPFLFSPYDDDWKREFWAQVEEFWEGLSSAIGCYAFCLNSGQSERPWYVGKTLSAGGFRGEVFQPHKILHYKEVLEGKRGQAFLLLFPLITESGRLSSNRSSSEGAVEWLETTLIGMALAKNPELRNSSKTKFLREVYVNGLIGGQFRGRPTEGAAAAKAVFL